MIDRRGLLLGLAAVGTTAAAQTPPPRTDGKRVGGLGEPGETIDLWPRGAPGAPRTLHVPHGSAAVFTGGLVHAGAKGSGARNLAAHWQSTAIAMAIPNEIAVCPGPQPDAAAGAGTTAAEEVFV